MANTARRKKFKPFLAGTTLGKSLRLLEKSDRVKILGVIAIQVVLAVLDLIGNLYKENLEAAIPLAIETFNHQLTLNITSNEVKNYYRHDARFWGFGQWTRRLDRYWQRHIRRRPYPFLLPGRVPR